MPQFYFHIRNTEEIEDFEGCACASVAAARARAIIEARALAADDVTNGRLDLRHRIEVKDEQGDTLFVVTFRDAIAVSG